MLNATTVRPLIAIIYIINDKSRRAAVTNIPSLKNPFKRGQLSGIYPGRTRYNVKRPVDR